jgi:protein-disulfide isomerase
LLFANQDTLGQYHLSAGDESGRLEAGLHYADRVEEDLQSGLRSGAGGTPTIYINGRPHRGAYDEVTQQRAIELAG